MKSNGISTGTVVGIAILSALVGGAICTTIQKNKTNQVEENLKARIKELQDSSESKQATLKKLEEEKCKPSNEKVEISVPASILEAEGSKLSRFKRFLQACSGFFKKRST